MSELQQAARAALAALEGVLDTYGEPLDLLSISGGAYEALQCRDAITALKAALAKPDEYARANPLGGPATMFDAIARRLRSGEPYDEVLDDYGLQHASAEPVQDHFPDVTKMVQEPVWIQPDHLQKARVAPFFCRVEPTQRCTDFVPLWTSPPQRKPLTPQQATELVQSVVSNSDRPIGMVAYGLLVVRALERAHGIGGDA